MAHVLANRDQQQIAEATSIVKTSQWLEKAVLTEGTAQEHVSTDSEKRPKRQPYT